MVRWKYTPCFKETGAILVLSIFVYSSEIVLNGMRASFKWFELGCLSLFSQMPNNDCSHHARGNEPHCIDKDFFILVNIVSQFGFMDEALKRALFEIFEINRDDIIDTHSCGNKISGTTNPWTPYMGTINHSKIFTQSFWGFLVHFGSHFLELWK